ncbi:MAG: acetyl-CoA carboxylase biotin carboxyl carrier protein [Solirubrobacterales bacterium]
MEMTPETIKALLDAFDQSDWREMVVTVGEDRLHVSRDPLPEGATLASSQTSPAPPQAAAPPASPASAGTVAGPTPEEASAAAGDGGSPAATGAAAAPPAGTPIESPSVGLFWRSPSPGAPPFVEVGDRVANGQTVCIVEVMKLMNHVPSPVDGVVSAILVDNGAPVEFGQTIVVVDPQG